MHSQFVGFVMRRLIWIYLCIKLVYGFQQISILFCCTRSITLVCSPMFCILKLSYIIAFKRIIGIFGLFCILLNSSWINFLKHSLNGMDLSFVFVRDLY